MRICENCGVELDDNMDVCPLCNGVIQVNPPGRVTVIAYKQKTKFGQRMEPKKKKVIWEIISVILLSGSTSTIVIDFILNKSITWSDYPVAFSLSMFAYVSFFAFWPQRTFIRMIASFVLSSFFIILLDSVEDGINWSFGLGIPLLFAGNIVAVPLILLIKKAKNKGVNLIAYTFIAISLFCVFTEGIITNYRYHALDFSWSIIVMGCTMPVILLLLFMHFRLKRGRSLEKIFHL